MQEGPDARLAQKCPQSSSGCTVEGFETVGTGLAAVRAVSYTHLSTYFRRAGIWIFSLFAISMDENTPRRISKSRSHHILRNSCLDAHMVKSRGNGGSGSDPFGFLHDLGLSLIHILLGGIALHRGYIAEMATGEGKTLVATLPVYRCV